MQNEPNSGSSRPRHWKAGDAGSRHAEKLGPRWIGWLRLARNGTRRRGNWTTLAQRMTSPDAYGYLRSLVFPNLECLAELLPAARKCRTGFIVTR